MPTETFFRLDEKKKRKILIGASREFEAKGIGKATVVNICKNIGIPRITFYSYFETLDDCYDYVNKTFRRECFLNLVKDEKINVDLIENNYKDTGELFENEGYYISQLSSNDGMKEVFLTLKNVSGKEKIVLQLGISIFKRYELGLLSRDALIIELKEINKIFL